MADREYVPPEFDPTSIGNLMVAEGVLTRTQLSELIADFHASGCDLLGRFALIRGMISKEKLSLLLIKQKARRNGGIEPDHIVEALEIAAASQERCDDAASEMLKKAEALELRLDEVGSGLKG